MAAPRSLSGVVAVASLWAACALLSGGCGKFGYDPLGAGAERDGGSVNGGGPAINETPVPPGETVPVKLRAGYYHTCALYSNGGVKCWGENSFGQLGSGDLEAQGDDPGETGDDSLPFLDFGSAGAVVDIGAGHWHTCALFESGAIKCWGDNQAGCLGNGVVGVVGDEAGELASSVADYLQPSGVSPVRMSVLKRNVCVIYDDSSLRCSGQNDYGQLGTETFTHLGDSPDEMGDNLLPINLGSGLSATRVIEGDYHTCALLSDGSVKCWGRNHFGRLGYGNTAHRGGNPGEMGDGLPPVELGTGRTAVELYRGYFGNCAKLDDDTFKCWGANLNGELGVGGTGNAGDEAAEMGDALATFAPDEAIENIRGGFHGWCLINSSRQLKCMGRNNLGQLGLGHTDSVGLNPGETWGSASPMDLGTDRILRGVSDANVAIGNEHVCVLLDDFKIRCWGRNDFGQLYQGDVEHRGDGPGEMGDALPSFRP